MSKTLPTDVAAVENAIVRQEGFLEVRNHEILLVEM
jgi:hypothetical protein